MRLNFKNLVHNRNQRRLYTKQFHCKNTVVINVEKLFVGSDKVQKIFKGSLGLIPSPSPLVKIQVMDGKVCLRCKGKTLQGVVNKLWMTKSLLTSHSNVLPYYLK